LTEQTPGQDQPADSARAAYGQAGRPLYGDGRASANPAPGGIGQSAPQQRGDAKGFLGALFDFGFTSFVTPKVVKVLYVLIVIGVGLSALLLAVTAFRVNVAFGFVALVIAAPLYFLVVTAFYRIALEFFMVIFRISDDIRAIRERGGLG
jgi:hypothetical protein